MGLTQPRPAVTSGGPFQPNCPMTPGFDQRTLQETPESVSGAELYLPVTNTPYIKQTYIQTYKNPPQNPKRHQNNVRVKPRQKASQLNPNAPSPCRRAELDGIFGSSDHPKACHKQGKGRVFPQQTRGGKEGGVLKGNSGPIRAPAPVSHSPAPSKVMMMMTNAAECHSSVPVPPKRRVQKYCSC